MPTGNSRGQIGIYIQMNEADAVIKSLEARKAPGKDDIQPMNGYFVCWPSHICKVARKTGQITKAMANQCGTLVMSFNKKGYTRKCTSCMVISLM